MAAKRTYSEAVQLLNSLQTNVAILEVLRKSGQKEYSKAIPEMLTYVARCGYKSQDFAAINAIHIAGTKGKGSTCAIIERILSQYRISGRPLKTGLYSSPHLMEVRERIRINGEPISKDLFAKYFFEIWDRLEESKGLGEASRKDGIAQQLGADKTGPAWDKPGYFRYLTLMAFHVFLREEVDVGIFEVGVGGRYDSTNVLENPLVTGITSLGYDHQGILGKTLAEIAWHKAGIFKKGVPAFSSPQPDEALQVLKEQAKKLGSASLSVIDRELPDNVYVGLAGKHQRVNAALAVSVCRSFINTCNEKATRIEPPLNASLPAEFITGLKTAKWPGRAQVIKTKGKTWLLDGAHTSESLTACAEWLKSLPVVETGLIFNCTGGRSFKDLLEPLSQLHRSNPLYFAYAPDLANNSIPIDAELKPQRELAQVWKELLADSCDVHVVRSIQEAVEIVHGRVLVTGSLHLVGGVLTVLEAGVE